MLDRTIFKIQQISRSHRADENKWVVMRHWGNHYGEDLWAVHYFTEQLGYTTIYVGPFTESEKIFADKSELTF